MNEQATSFWRSGNPRVLFASFLYFDTSFMVWVLLGALGTYVAADLGLSPTQKGLMTAIPVLSGAALRPVAGIAADHFGGRRTGLFGLGFTLVPLTLGWLVADSLPLLVVTGVLLGVAGASFAVAMPLASRWYPAEHQGLALGLAGAGNGGTVLAAMFAPRLAEAFGWHAVLGLAMIPIAVSWSVFVLFARDSPAPFAPRTLKDFVAVLREREARWFCLFYAVTFGGFIGLASYLAIFFHDQYGVGRVAAGDLTGACVLAGSLARPIGGFVADRVGGTRVLVAVFATIAATMSLLSHLPPTAISVTLLLGGMMAMGLGNGAVFQLIPQRFSGRMGSVTGLVGACGGLGGFAVPFLIGMVRDATGSYGGGFLLLALPAGFCAVALAGIKGSWADDERASGVPAPRTEPGQLHAIAIEEPAR